jgi:hypothetical protein
LVRATWRYVREPIVRLLQKQDATGEKEQQVMNMPPILEKKTSRSGSSKKRTRRRLATRAKASTTPVAATATPSTASSTSSTSSSSSSSKTSGTSSSTSSSRSSRSKRESHYYYQHAVERVQRIARNAIFMLGDITATNDAATINKTDEKRSSNADSLPLTRTWTDPTALLNAKAIATSVGVSAVSAASSSWLQAERSVSGGSTSPAAATTSVTSVKASEQLDVRWLAQLLRSHAPLDQTLRVLIISAQTSALLRVKLIERINAAFKAQQSEPMVTHILPILWSLLSEASATDLLHDLPAPGAAGSSTGVTTGENDHALLFFYKYLASTLTQLQGARDRTSWLGVLRVLQFFSVAFQPRDVHVIVGCGVLPALASFLQRNPMVVTAPLLSSSPVDDDEPEDALASLEGRARTRAWQTFLYLTTFTLAHCAPDTSYATQAMTLASAVGIQLTSLLRHNIAASRLATTSSQMGPYLPLEDTKALRVADECVYQTVDILHLLQLFATAVRNPSMGQAEAQASLMGLSDSSSSPTGTIGARSRSVGVAPTSTIPSSSILVPVCSVETLKLLIRALTESASPQTAFTAELPSPIQYGILQLLRTELPHHTPADFLMETKESKDSKTNVTPSTPPLDVPTSLLTLLGNLLLQSRLFAKTCEPVVTAAATLFGGDKKELTDKVSEDKKDLTPAVAGPSSSLSSLSAPAASRTSSTSSVVDETCSAWGYRSWEITPQGRDLAINETIWLIRSLIALPSPALIIAASGVAAGNVTTSWCDSFMILIHGHVAKLPVLVASLTQRQQDNDARIGEATEKALREKEKESKDKKDSEKKESGDKKVAEEKKAEEKTKTDSTASSATDKKTNEEKEKKTAEDKATREALEATQTAAKQAAQARDAADNDIGSVASLPLAGLPPPLADVNALKDDRVMSQALAITNAALHVIGAHIPLLCKGAAVDAYFPPSSEFDFASVTQTSTPSPSSAATSWQANLPPVVPQFSSPLLPSTPPSNTWSTLALCTSPSPYASSTTASVSASSLAAPSAVSSLAPHLSLVRGRVAGYDPIQGIVGVRLATGYRDGRVTSLLVDNLSVDTVTAVEEIQAPVARLALNTSTFVHLIRMVTTVLPTNTDLYTLLLISLQRSSLAVLDTYKSSWSTGSLPGLPLPVIQKASFSLLPALMKISAARSVDYQSTVDEMTRDTLLSTNLLFQLCESDAPRAAQGLTSTPATAMTRGPSAIAVTSATSRTVGRAEGTTRIVPPASVRHQQRPQLTEQQRLASAAQAAAQSAGQAAAAGGAGAAGSSGSSAAGSSGSSGASSSANSASRPAAASPAPPVVPKGPPKILQDLETITSMGFSTLIGKYALAQRYITLNRSTFLCSPNHMLNTFVLYRRGNVQEALNNILGGNYNESEIAEDQSNTQWLALLDRTNVRVEVETWEALQASKRSAAAAASAAASAPAPPPAAPKMEEKTKAQLDEEKAEADRKVKEEKDRKDREAVSQIYMADRFTYAALEMRRRMANDNNPLPLRAEVTVTEEAAALWSKHASRAQQSAGSGSSSSAYTAGDKLSVLDTVNKVCPAEVLEVTNGKVLIHYIGWYTSTPMIVTRVQF